MASLSDVRINYGDSSDDTVTDVDSAIQKLYIVLSVPLGARKYYPAFGARLISRLFEPFDAITADWLGVDVTDAIENPANEINDIFTNVKTVVTLGRQTYNVAITFDIVLPSGEVSRNSSYQFSAAPDPSAFALPTRTTGLRRY